MVVEKLLHRVLYSGTVASAVAFIASVIIQVYARFFMDSAPSWTEEASRLFFIYTMSFASGLAFKSRDFVFLDLFYSSLTDQWKRILDVTIAIGVSFLFLVFGFYALEYIQLGKHEKSATMSWSMAWAFGSMLLMASAILFYSLMDIKTALFRK